MNKIIAFFSIFIAISSLTAAIEKLPSLEATAGFVCASAWAPTLGASLASDPEAGRLQTVIGFLGMASPFGMAALINMPVSTKSKFGLATAFTGLGMMHYYLNTREGAQKKD